MSISWRYIVRVGILRQGRVDHGCWVNFSLVFIFQFKKSTLAFSQNKTTNKKNSLTEPADAHRSGFLFIFLFFVLFLLELRNENAQETWWQFYLSCHFYLECSPTWIFLNSKTHVKFSSPFSDIQFIELLKKKHIEQKSQINFCCRIQPLQELILTVHRTEHRLVIRRTGERSHQGGTIRHWGGTGNVVSSSLSQMIK